MLKITTIKNKNLSILVKINQASYKYERFIYQDFGVSYIYTTELYELHPKGLSSYQSFFIQLSIVLFSETSKIDP